MGTPAVFLDRDGTLIEDVGYVDRLDRLKLYPWSLESVRLLRRAGYAVVVVTNQAGVARGMVQEATVVEAFEWIQAVTFGGDRGPLDRRAVGDRGGCAWRTGRDWLWRDTGCQPAQGGEGRCDRWAPP
jgi:hypothetical protein